MEQSLRFEGFARPEEVRRSPYLYLPFTVPPKTTRLEVSYTYSDPVTAPFGMGPGNTVDIGLFDSRGIDFLDDHGFRGWSGSAKRQFFVAQGEATPGYIPGPLYHGDWNLVLGLARVQEEGVRYDVQVKLTNTESPAAAHEEAPAPTIASSIQRPPQRSGPRGGRWLKGDLHCHTVHSDGLNSVEELALSACERGLDFLAVTDHNTSTHHAELARLSHLPLVLIPGEEVTTYGGHANVWGLRQWIEFRCADQEAMQAVQNYVQRRGGLISVNHPKSLGSPWLFDDGGYPCMEVWQAPWRFYNWESLERWEGHLMRGRRIVAVGGSDVHSIPPAPPLHPHGLGNPTTWVYVDGEAGEDAILDAIRRGRAFISDDPSGSQLILTADGDGDGRFEKRAGDTVEAAPGQRLHFRAHVIDGAERRLWLICDGLPLDVVPLTGDDYVHTFSLEPSGRRYLRAELRGPSGRPERGEVVWAMTNPIWLNTREP